jgi:hypothetical protein
VSVKKRISVSYLAVLAGLFFIGFAVAGTAQIGNAVPAGCEPFLGPITESPEFTPPEARRSQPRDFTLDPEGQGPPTSTLVLDGLSVQWAAFGGSTLFFAESPVSGMLLSEFFASGGLQLYQEMVSDGVIFAEHLNSEIGDRATGVVIGAYNGALTWADPDLQGTRTHNLYWSDGIANYSLIGVREPAELINLGRFLECGLH